MSSKEIQNPIFNDDDDLDGSDEDSEDEEEEDSEDEGDKVNLNRDSTLTPPLRNLNDDDEEDDVIDLDNVNDDFNSEPSLVTVAVLPPADFDNSKSFSAKSEQKRPRIDQVQLYPVQEEKKVQQQPLDDSRKLFQRLWTDEDEIELLQGFLEYMTQRGISYHNHHDLGLFYEQIKCKLQLDFNKNQLVEKMRRLKRKYRNVLNRNGACKDIYFKTPHDQATNEISLKIWSDLSSNKDGGDNEDTPHLLPLPLPLPLPYLTPSPNYNVFNPSDNPLLYYANMNGVYDGRKSQSSTKRSRVRIEEKRVSDERVLKPSMGQAPAPISTVELGPGIQGLIEETVKNCLSPLIKEALQNGDYGQCASRVFGGVGTLRLNYASPSSLMGGEVSVRKWRKQQILELEVYSKRLELVQEQINVTLEELRSGRS